MNRVQVERRPVAGFSLAANEPDKVTGTRPAREGDYRTLVREPTVFVERGKPLVAYLPFEEPAGTYEALCRLHYVRDFRTGGLPVNSRTVGYLPRNTVRRDYCTSTSCAKDHPTEHALLAGPCAREVAAKYEQANPRLYTEHAIQVEKAVRPEYRMGATPFTSAIANDTLPINYHYDSGNFKNVWSGMFVLRRGVQGGHLVLPELGVALECADRTLVLFDGQGLLHGVTPIQRTARDGHRFTVVYYSMEAMWKCLAPQEEIRRIAKLRTERERRPRSVPKGARKKGT